MSDLKDRRNGLLKSARALAEKVMREGRDFTPDEQKKIDDALAESRSINETLHADAKHRQIMGELDSMVESDQDFGGGADAPRFMSFGKAFSANAAERTLPFGQKALATGSSVFVDPEFTRTPIPIGRPATALLNVLPVNRHGQPAYSYIRQSVRTNAAAVVAEGATKPTSTYTIVKVDGSLSVIAHLSEPVARYWFEDAASLKPFMENELSYGLQLAVESKALADINGTSGVQTQAYDTSKLKTIRKCITKLTTQGFDPSAIVVHPLDWEDIELALSSTTAVEFRGLPYDPVARRLYGIPVVVANVQASGVGHVLASGAVALDTDTTGVAIQWSETSNATDFAENKVRARCEGRFGTSVFQPLGVVKADLTAD